jgi:Kef-type K+ transport system membrane component KefB
MHGWLLPARLSPILNVLAQLGLIFFMFFVGHELDVGLLRKRGSVAVVVSHVGIALPLLAGIVLAAAMHPRFAPPGIGFVPFALFLGVAMSVTAFPVLARILSDRGLQQTPVGILSIACASVDDVTAWCLLTLVVSAVHGDSPAVALRTVALVAMFFLAMVFVARPVLARVVEKAEGTVDSALLVVLLLGVMLAALATNSIGVHPIFGAFLFGAIVPRKSVRVERAVAQLSGVTSSLLLPLFFVYTGLRTRVGLLGADGGLWLWCALVIMTATLSKWAGSTGAARLCGLGWPDSFSLGALMNCRGLTELVVLSIGLDLGVITPTLFTMLVIMAVTSTVVTSPALGLIARARRDVRSPVLLPDGG